MAHGDGAGVIGVDARYLVVGEGDGGCGDALGVEHLAELEGGDRLGGVLADDGVDLGEDGTRGVGGVGVDDLLAEVAEVVVGEVFPLWGVSDDVAEDVDYLDATGMLPYPCSVEGVAPGKTVVGGEVTLSDCVGVFVLLVGGEKLLPAACCELLCHNCMGFFCLQR